MVDALSLVIVGCHVQVQCPDAAIRALLMAKFGHMQGHQGPVTLQYSVGRLEAAGGFFVSRPGQAPLMAVDSGELLFLFEKDLTVELEKLRPDLYFVHAAVLAFGHEAVMLVGESGSGKSTTTWALLHHGYRYFSDELGPVDLQTGTVYPYPHALCLKGVPPGPYPLPTNTLYTAQALHIPTAVLPSEVGERPAPLSAIFFVQYRPGTTAPAVQALSKAEAAARLFANALNPLAHRGDGLDGAIKLATRVASLKLFSADLTATCALVKGALKRLLSHEEGKKCREGPRPHR